MVDCMLFKNDQRVKLTAHFADAQCLVMLGVGLIPATFTAVHLHKVVKGKQGDLG